ncbi:hypothetical protein DFR70_12713 [Nocardia tenerifensis]|uniref:Uncharacterized protein n=1 Tax=Nocardia tenerifensis TaxID=228006 RepID=A0A318JNP5_9NOCA|nr:hypothetical protein [Nocardia tenerifensis]PXX53402.1 hypothetical protein DFR70_12713 [Nocardia tenerifensis]
MTYDQLMQHAKEIREKAVEVGSQEEPRELAEKRYQHIEPLFEPFSRLPDPAKYDPLIFALKAAMAELNNQSVTHTDLSKDVALQGTDLARMITTGGYLDAWTGDAAIVFKANFIDRFTTISGNQFTAMSVMKGVLEAQQAMWRAARVDIDNIAHVARDALNNSGGYCPANWKYGATVLSAITTVIGVGITAVTGGVASIAAVGAAATMSNAMNDAAQLPMNSASAIIGAMTHAIEELFTRIHDAQLQKIVPASRTWVDELHKNRDLMVSARPNLADMNDRELIGRGGMGKPNR